MFCLLGVRAILSQRPRLRSRVILRVSTYVAEGDRAGPHSDARIRSSNRVVARPGTAGAEHRAHRSASVVAYHW